MCYLRCPTLLPCLPSVPGCPRERLLSVMFVGLQVASLDEDACRYVAAMRALKPKVTQLGPKSVGYVMDSEDQYKYHTMADIVRDVIVQREEKRGGGGGSGKVRHVMYLRDGVADNEFGDVLREAQVLRATVRHTLETGAAVAMTTVVVQKRHQTRFFPKEPANESENVPPGLVVDANLVHLTPYDNFYMVSHAGIKGTSHPVRYFVLQNELGLEKEVLIHFLFQTCHLMGRAQRSVSIPAPVYYAHILAERARVLGLKAIEETLGYDFVSDAQSMASGPATAADQDRCRQVANTALAEHHISHPMFFV
eukprot:GHVU01113667.1.p1 GENE.GHVU01113667.1~~GHVU01113667.1.p1  ORF type:complete len:309 (+),score=40.33 GHVU01113667.1:3196-4122(+)